MGETLLVDDSRSVWRKIRGLFYFIKNWLQVVCCVSKYVYIPTQCNSYKASCRFSSLVTCVEMYCWQQPSQLLEVTAVHVESVACIQSLATQNVVRGSAPWSMELVRDVASQVAAQTSWNWSLSSYKILRARPCAGKFETLRTAGLERRLRNQRSVFRFHLSESVYLTLGSSVNSTKHRISHVYKVGII